MYDVIFKNGNVVDVKNEQILQADIAVKDGKIAGIGHFSGENVIDCTGKYITPGFIDAHVHIESSMATPMEFSKAVMPHGTTTVIADPHELVNVKGNEAMDYGGRYEAVEGPSACLRTWRSDVLSSGSKQRRADYEEIRAV